MLPNKPIGRVAVAGSVILAIAVATGGVIANGNSGVRAVAQPRVMARPISDTALIRAAGFPQNALHVNSTSDGKLSWMMTRSEIRRQASYEAKYLEPARKMVAASLTEQSPNVTSQLFGLSDESTEMIAGIEFEGGLADTLLTRSSNGSVSCVATSLATDFLAQVRLPAGARVTGMTAYGVDTSLTDDTDVYLEQTCFGGVNNGSGTAPEVHVTSGFTGGFYAVASGASDLVVDNSDCVYLVRASTSDGLLCSATNNLGAVALRWKRQVSPDPPYATFTDVPQGAPFHRDIEALVASGITVGCGNGRYCPENPVTRGQMAAFLSRALGLHWSQN